ncbi:TetR/AcrR family transcriptional regulator C-terminal domain-containing protein [Kitasatospora sp. CM 4170]|uniref:TetR/AcrR family transcriptional regulator C-terminal domain-containing protein n=1 Tax=Kitasatospora aburaviensis TaxID=67265 RepID=A0ABW1F9L8_9ACTN|nr:TetR/AcrR family transcriptional regulator C-terminal domain-containing protein [Kitasatospora sp. CM 4170]WNM43220.1 TetR/AcrR family transcriptional regulator C-terminal domain-containing protein [Kitasatospora sp. CM 4170]
MTKNQPRTSTRTGLDPDTVVRAALELLDEKGADGVSLRGIAERLGVRMNTVLWHAKTKARLLELMADAILAGIPLTDLPEPWDERVPELARRYRRCLLDHRDGAVVVAGTYAAEPATLAFAEVTVAALLDGGLDERQAAWAFWTVQYLVLGLTQEEQALAASADDHTLARALAPGGYPALSRVAPHLEDASFDERFEFGLSLLLHSLRTAPPGRT